MVTAPSAENEKAAAASANLNLSQLIQRLKEKLDDRNKSESSTLKESINDLKKTIVSAKIDEILSVLDESALETIISAACETSDFNALLDCSDIFDIFFRSIPVDQIFFRFTPQIIVGLNCKTSAVKSKLLQSIRKTLESHPESLEHMLGGNAPILIATCRCCADESSDVFADAKRLLVQIAKNERGVHALFRQSDLAMNAIKEVMGRGDTYRFRIYELAVEWSKMSPELLTVCVENGFIAALLRELEGDDVLLKLNTLEMLTDMSVDAPLCLAWFFDNGVLQKLYTLFRTAQASPDGTFLFPGTMKFFGHLARIRPRQCCEQFPEFLKAVFHLVYNVRLLDVGQRLLAFDSLGIVASTSEGKFVLANYENEMRQCMPCFAPCIREGPMELRARHLEALNNIMHIKPEDSENAQIFALTERWFKQISESPMAMMFDILKQPFADIKGPAIEIFKSLITQPWAQTLMVQQAGFVEYLRSPLKEKDAENNRNRHELVGLLLHSRSAGENLSPENIGDLRAFYDQGPFYRPVAKVEIALEQA